MNKINLIKDTIDKSDIDYLVKWLKTYPRLTKGEQTIKFEKKYSEWQGCEHSIFVNSGSSANLAMLYALKLSGRMKNKKVVVPAISWATTVAPVLQLGFEPIVCDVNLDNLGIDIKCLKKIIKKHKPSTLILVNVLGFMNDMDAIVDICDENHINLLEDSCETQGSTYKGIKAGSFGLMSSFSFYFGHVASTIEGGMICTDKAELNHYLTMIRSHGWDRDLPDSWQKQYREKYNVDDFNALYTFYYPGFNIRSTDLQAYIGLKQIDKLDDVIKKRQTNFLMYQQFIKSNFWMIAPTLGNVDDIICNFAYPIMHPKQDEIVKKLAENGVDTRPIVCGNMGRQPFIKEAGIIIYDNNAREVDKYGLYVPNHPYLKQEEIEFICNIVNGVIK